MYEAHLRSLLSPLGIYDLEEHSASGADGGRCGECKTIFNRYTR